MSTGRSRLLLGLLLVLVGGCSQGDAERLSRVARVAGQKIESSTGTSRDRFIAGIHTMQNDLDGLNLETRVSARLHWDRTLSEAEVEVHAEGSEVKLSGKLRDAEQRRRAVELANSTVGVEKVVDELTAPEKE
jgi:osmotically-inducible protein OsmY